jgi:hypothetical protein
MRWFDEEKDPPPFLKALEETRRMATREGWHYQHVRAIIVAINQYAEAAIGNRDSSSTTRPARGRAMCRDRNRFTYLGPTRPPTVRAGPIGQSSFGRRRLTGETDHHTQMPF